MLIICTILHFLFLFVFFLCQNLHKIQITLITSKFNFNKNEALIQNFWFYQKVVDFFGKNKQF